MRRHGVLLATFSLTLLAWAGCSDDDTDASSPSDTVAGHGGISAAGGSGGKAGAGGSGGAGRGGSGSASSSAGRGNSGGSGGKPNSSGTGGSAGSAVATSSQANSADSMAVTIRFKAVVGDREFSCGRDYTGLGTTKRTATPQDFRFFVQEIHLLASDGSEVPLALDERASLQTKDVALVDFTNATGLCGGFGSTTNTEVTGTAPRGTYTGVVFVNGVPDALNHQNLTMAKPPLQDTATFWGWLSGYRFIMAEISRKDQPDQDAGPADPVTLIHIGSSACTGNVGSGYSCAHPNRNRVRISGFDPTQRAIVADFAKVYENIDLTAGVQCHGTGAECKPMYDAFGVDIATGQALATQTVFRAE